MVRLGRMFLCIALVAAIIPSGCTQVKSPDIVLPDPTSRLIETLKLTNEQLGELESGTGTLQLTEEQVNILSDYVTQLLEDLEPWLDEAQWQEARAILESMLTEGLIHLETLAPVAEAISAALDAMDEAGSGVTVYTNLVRVPAGEAGSPERCGPLSGGTQLSTMVLKYTPGDSGYGDRRFEQPRTVSPRTLGKGDESVASANHLDGSMGAYSEALLLGGATTYALQRILIHVPADNTYVTIEATIQSISGTITSGVPPPVNSGSTATTTVGPYEFSGPVLDLVNQMIHPTYVSEEGIMYVANALSDGVGLLDLARPIGSPVNPIPTGIGRLLEEKDIGAFYSALLEYGDEEVVTHYAESLSAGDYYFELGLRPRAEATIGVAWAYLVGLIREIEVTMDVPTHTLTVTSTDGGQVTQPGEGTFDYWAGGEVDLVAEADDRYVFTGWTGDTAAIADPASPSTKITMSGDYSITASFAHEEESVHFADPNLEAAVRQAIGKPTGDIYASDLAGLTLLDASKRDIGDLTGLEHCINLAYLTLSVNQISDISPLEGLSHLIMLDLASNQISDVEPLVDNDGLGEGDHVWLGNNPLSEQSINEYIPALQARGVTVNY